MRSPLQDIECFHLLFLRLLESRLDRRTWVVKGDVNLRAWFASVRYSADLDLDLLRGSVHSVQERVDGLLAAKAFRELLTVQGLTLLRSWKPKQTETTQRWKFELRAEGKTVSLPTRAEFSRKREGGDYALEPARADVVRPYGFLAPTANHYTAAAAMRQKIEALAHRRETQARDIWDLAHLFRTTQASPGPLVGAAAKTLELACERALSLAFDVFKGQVVPYLPPEHQALYRTADAWDRICEAVVERLSELRL